MKKKNTFNFRYRHPSHPTWGSNDGYNWTIPDNEVVETNQNNEIGQVCTKCGIAANYLTCWKKYGAPPLKMCFDVSTFHLGTCDFCGIQTNVTEPRDFFYPDFSLLSKAVKNK